MYCKFRMVGDHIVFIVLFKATFNVVSAFYIFIGRIWFYRKARTATLKIASGTDVLDTFWDLNVRHFGVLDADSSEFATPQEVDDVFALMKVMFH